MSVREKLEQAMGKTSDAHMSTWEEAQGFYTLRLAIRRSLALLDEMERDHEAMEKLRSDVRKGFCPTLVFDDIGAWAVSYEGHQAVGVKQITTTTVVLDPNEVTWFTDPADAILGKTEPTEET